MPTGIRPFDVRYKVVNTNITVFQGFIAKK